MPSSVIDLLQSIGLEHGGAVGWGDSVPTTRPGVYLISLASSADGTSSALRVAPISVDRVRELLIRAPGLTLDGVPNPEPDQVVERLCRLWLFDEVVLYIGKATSLRTRVGQYYVTRLGDRRPHAGGWPLKTLGILESLWVHWAESPRPELAEQQLLAAFVDGTSPEARNQLIDPEHPYPFANLEGPGGRKRHGFGNAKHPSNTPDGSEGIPGIPRRPKPPSGGAAGRKRATPDRSYPTLHEEIAAILEAYGNRWMTTTQIAEQVRLRGIYKKRDGSSDVAAFQVHGRTKNYPHLFERRGDRVRLRRNGLSR